MKKRFVFLIFLFLTSVLKSQGVGKTDGNFSVSLAGGASYSVPIKNLPGIKDMVPSISLDYSNQSGNGVAGWGWNIQGVSSITRVSSTKFHDGVIDPIDYDSTDRFALDGQRLILKTGTYGGDNAEYQTENYSNVKIVSKGTSPDGPSYFIVYYPNGNVAVYGNDANSKNSFEWKISYIDDVKYNRIEYGYMKEGANTIYLSTVKYGGNPSVGQYTPVNEINFYYQNSSRNEQNYVYDSKFVYLTKKLERIEVKGNGLLYRKYGLTYDVTSLNYERLTQIKEYNSAGESVVPIIFEYDTTVNGLTNNSRTLTSVSPAFDNSSWNYVSGYFDKDGALDFMTYPGSKDKLYRFNSSTLLNSSSNISGNLINVEKFTDIFSTKLVLANNKFYGLDALSTVSNNGSMMSPEEIVKVNNYISNTTYNSLDLTFSNSYTFPTAENYQCFMDNPIYARIPKKYISGDFDGDGVSDIIAISLPYYNSYPTSDCGNGPVLDPGDGSNPCCIKDNYNNISNFYFLKSDANNTGIQDPLFIGSNNIITSSSRLYVADFNGDGKSDLYVMNNLKISVFSFENNSFTLLHETSNAFYTLSKPVYLTDFNGDGKTDLITPDTNASSNWIILTSNGKSFQAGYINTGITYHAPQVINTCYPNGSGGQLCGYMLQAFYYIFSDINGDGKADAIIHDVLTPYNYPQGGQWNYPYNQYGDNFTVRDKGSIRYNIGNDANGFPSFSAYIDNWQNNFTNGGATNKGTPILLNNPTATNQNLDYAFFGGDKIKYVSFKKDNRVDVALKRIKENDILTTINYSPLLDNGNGVYIEDQEELYPYANINNSLSTQLVAQVTKSFNGESKIQDYKYKGAVVNFEGIGFLGFKGVATSSVYGGTITQKLWTVSKQSPQKRGANIESYLINGSPNFDSPASFVTKTRKTFSSTLLSNKVFVNLPTEIQQIDNLTGVTKYTYFDIYDVYNNATKTRDVAPGGEKITLFEFDNNPLGISNQYFIGRQTKKTETQTLGSETFSTEQLFSYANNLVSQFKKKGNATDFITEDYQYDNYGNLIQKTMSAPNMTARVEKMQYDASGRFIVKSTNILGFEDKFNYNSAFGPLLSKTNHLNQTVSYEYDGWQKKIKEKDIYNNETNFTYDWITSGDFTNGIKIKVTEPTGATSETYNDVWGRKRVERKLSLNNKWIDIRTDYNLFDKPYRVSNPYFSTATPSQWTVSEFDEYNRIKKMIFPTGKMITTSYNGLNVTVVEGTKTQTTTSDAWGNKIKSSDNGGTVNYSYFANGGLKTSDYGGYVINFEQDGWGKKTKMYDPAVGGYYTYEYDNLGQLLKEENPKGKTLFTYDQFGRVIHKKIEGDATDIETDYNYNSLGLLESELGTSNGIPNTFNYQYDNYYRFAEKEEDNGFAIFKKNYSYDNFGRISEEFTQTSVNSVSSEFKHKNFYASCGVLYKITDDGDKLIWQLNGTNEKEEILNAQLGNGTEINNEYDGNFYLHSIKHHNSISANIIENIYNFSAMTGTLQNRNNTVIQGGWLENFEYDNQQRLVAWTYPNGSQSQTYDAYGRIDNNSNVGDYKYNGVNRYRKETINLNSAGDAYYSANPLQEVEYNSYRMPTVIKQEGYEMAHFNYNIHQRRSASDQDFYSDFFVYGKGKIYSDDSSVEIINYNYLGKPNVNALGMRIITYIANDPYTAPAVYIKDFNVNMDLLSEGIHYLHRDYQSTILAISDQKGNVEERRHFDPWGNLVYLEKNGTVINLNKQAPDLMIERGYTGHEHFFQVGLIHMNGRMYDPKLHTFLSVDNYIQDPFNTQNYNRYGYVLNNPLAYTDPSGELFSFITAIFDTFKNIFTHGVNFGDYDYSRTSKAWKIDMGLFKGNFGQILSRFTWESDQSMLGYLSSGFYNLFGGVKSVTYYDGATAVESYKPNWGGFTLGNFIIGDRGLQADPNNSLFQHEYGHYLQSQKFGLFYMQKFAIPSFFDTLSKNNHTLHYAEQDANSRAFTYFNKHVENYNGWDRRNVIVGYDWSKSFNDISNQMALSSNLTHLKWYDAVLFATSGYAISGISNYFINK